MDVVRGRFSSFCSRHRERFGERRGGRHFSISRAQAAAAGRSGSAGGIEISALHEFKWNFHFPMLFPYSFSFCCRLILCVLPFTCFPSVLHCAPTHTHSFAFSPSNAPRPSHSEQRCAPINNSIIKEFKMFNACEHIISFWMMRARRLTPSDVGSCTRIRRIQNRNAIDSSPWSTTRRKRANGEKM